MRQKTIHQKLDALIKQNRRIENHLDILLNDDDDSSEVLKAIKQLRKENKENFMLNQAAVDKMVADIEAGKAKTLTAITEESAEIQSAIASRDVDTTALEAAIANSDLSQNVKDIFTETPPAEEPPVEPSEPTS